MCMKENPLEYSAGGLGRHKLEKKTAIHINIQLLWGEL